jgi:uncharacterized protein
MKRNPHLLARSIVAGCALLLTLSGCNDASGSGDAGAAAPAASALEVIPLTVVQGTETHSFTVEVARTPDEQARGLMGRTELAADRGMLFPYNPPQTASFWMRNTLIPLDIIFIRSDGSIDRLAENAIPQDETPVASGSIIAAVLELPGGTAERLNLDESATVSWEGGPQAATRP